MQELKREDSDYMISAFIESIRINKGDQRAIKQTIQGIYHSVKFSLDIFRESKAQPIMDCIYETLQNEDPEIRMIAMQCIVEIVRVCYEYISPFMVEITDHTFNHARNDEKEVQTQAIEVWASIAEEENTRLLNNQRINNIIDTAFDMLVELLKEAIQDSNMSGEEDDDEQDWCSSVAAG